MSTSATVLKRQAMTTLGGIAAEWIDGGKRDDAQFGGPDVFRAFELATRLEGTDPDERDVDEVLARANALYVLLLGQTVATLEARWDAVLAVADALAVEEGFSRQRLLALVSLGK